MLEINLLPPDVKEKLKKTQNTPYIFYSSILFVLILIILTLYFSQNKNNTAKLALAENQETITKNKVALQNFNTLQQDIIFLNDRFILANTIKNSQTAWSDDLQVILDATPNDLQISSMDIDLTKDPNFILKVTTSNNQSIATFEHNLDKSAFFRNVIRKNNSIIFNLAPSGVKK